MEKSDALAWVEVLELPLRNVLGSKDLVNGTGCSCRKYSSGVWKAIPILEAKSLQLLSIHIKGKPKGLCRHQPVGRCMICFGIGPCCAAASITNEKRGLQIRTISLIEIQLIEELLPRSDARFPVKVTSSSGQEEDWEVKVTEDGGHLGLEVYKTFLIALDRLRIISQAYTALIGNNYDSVPRQQRPISRHGHAIEINVSKLSPHLPIRMKILEDTGDTEMPPPPVCGIFGKDIARSRLN